MTLPYYDAHAVDETLTVDAAMDALEAALRAGLDPEADGPRVITDAPDGHFLIMPAQGGTYAGVKALTVAPNNPPRGLEKIQGVYVLYSADTLAPIALMDGARLTAIRTPAVAIMAVRQLARLAIGTTDELPEAPRILMFGAGVQAPGHIRAARTAFPQATFEVIGRTPERVSALVENLRSEGITATHRTGPVGPAVAEANIILCLTTASTPLFDGGDVAPGAIVAAVGTHGHDHRELDDALISRSDVVVEGRASAERENGNLLSLGPADWRGERVVNLADLAQGRFSRTPGAPAVYTGVGMSWEDLVCAGALHEAMQVRAAPAEAIR